MFGLALVLWLGFRFRIMAWTVLGLGLVSCLGLWLAFIVIFRAGLDLGLGLE